MTMFEWQEATFTHTLLAFAWGSTVVQIHGRSAHQRYTREADWNYLGSCVEAAQSVLYNDDGVEAPPVPIIGNGDVLRYPEFYDHIRDTGVTTCMIGRGVLIKVRTDAVGSGACVRPVCSPLLTRA